MSGERVLTNARIVTADAVMAGTLRVAGGRIADLDTGASALPAAEDLEGDLLLPGLVELHTDNLEKHFAPRPGVRWPPLPAVVAHDAQLVAAGITTVFDALALGDLFDGTLRTDHLAEMAWAVAEGTAQGWLRAEHFLHLRCELSDARVLDLLGPFEGHPLVRLVSLMDHSPGQRQFTSLEKYREYYQGKYGLSDAELERFIRRQREASARHSAPHRAHIAALCRDRGLPMASHDDATPEHVAEAAALGMGIAEFPTTGTAARAARTHGLAILMGAPNTVRGHSHSGNVSARALAAEGLLDILSSDYFPASLLQAAFALESAVPGIALPAAVAAVSRNPARAAGLADRGEIAPGLRADLVRVRPTERFPLVRQVWRAGERVF